MASFPPVLQLIIAGYLGPKACYICNIAVPIPVFAAASQNQDRYDVIMYAIETQWVEALAIAYDEEYIPLKLLVLRIACTGSIPMLDFAASLGVTSWDGALLNAARGGHISAMEYMAFKGATLWNAALREAAESGQIPAIEYAMSRGANDLIEALRNAACGGHVHAMKYLSFRGANNWIEALRDAARNGHIPAMEYAASRGADNWNDALRYAKNIHIKRWLRRKLRQN